MKAITVIALAILLTACQKPPETSKRAGSSFDVEKLFTVDGCTVYRFYDDRTVYFTDCQGATRWTESHGKTSSDVQVN